jgi:hypothetical protein
MFWHATGDEAIGKALEWVLHEEERMGGVLRHKNGNGKHLGVGLIGRGEIHGSAHGARRL